MNLDAIEVGQAYEVPGELKDHHFPDYARASLLDVTGPFTVVEKCVPYGKRQTRNGVRLRYTRLRPRRCQACGNGWVEDENGELVYDEAGTIDAVVPASMIEGRWDQRELRRDLHRLGRVEPRAAPRQRRPVQLYHPGGHHRPRPE